MADVSQELTNMFNAAKQALNDDLKQNYYNAAQQRTQAFRQLNNNANNNHSMFSGVPAAAQMQYDQDTMLPNAATLAQRAIAKQQTNQENWDTYMEQIQKYQDQANYYNELTSKLGGSTS